MQWLARFVVCSLFWNSRLDKYRPDMTRSGYFPRAASEETEDITDGDTTDGPESSDSEDSADEEDDAEDKALIEQAADAELDAWSEHATIESLALDTPPSLFRNASTRYIHIVADESGARFRCGREVTTSYQQLSEVPKFFTPQCRQCFRWYYVGMKNRWRFVRHCDHLGCRCFPLGECWPLGSSNMYNTDVHYLSHLVTFEVLPHELMVSHVVTHDLTCTWLRGDSWGGLYICCRLTLHL